MRTIQVNQIPGEHGRTIARDALAGLTLHWCPDRQVATLVRGACVVWRHGRAEALSRLAEDAEYVDVEHMGGLEAIAARMGAGE